VVRYTLFGKTLFTYLQSMKATIGNNVLWMILKRIENVVRLLLSLFLRDILYEAVKSVMNRFEGAV
jgi:hypothetical protein